MGRPKTYEREDVLDNVIGVFWRNGYSDTSIAQLEEATGISRISLYHEFKDKEQLFLAALERYHIPQVERVRQKFETAELEDLERFFAQLGSNASAQSVQRLGCLLVNTAVEQRPLPLAITNRVKAYRQLVVDNFAFLLERHKEKLLDPSSIENKAEFLTATMWGMAVTSRLFRSPAHSGLAADQIVETIRLWYR